MNPPARLDHVAGEEIMIIFQDLALHSKKAVFIVTHDPRIFPFANRIINIDDGQITI